MENNSTKNDIECITGNIENNVEDLLWSSLGF